MKPAIEILADAEALAHEAATLILAQSLEVVSVKGTFSIGLSGGSTPKKLYELLANPNKEFFGQAPWDRTHYFWTDERHVAPDHPESNYRMANEAMLAHVPVPNDNVHRVLGELTSAQEAATQYQSQLTMFFGELPRLDLVLLGMGTDGHTASIFPGSEVLTEKRRLVSAPWVEKLNSYRITLTLPVLNNANAVVFLVSGEEKADILREVLKGPDARFPAQAIQPTHGTLRWLLDSAAGSRL